MRPLFLRLSVLLCALGACNPGPKETCAPPSDGLAFTDLTAEVGLEGYPGGRLSSADIDGDGRPDLFIHPVGTHTRDDPAAGVQTRFVLLNRAGADGAPAFTDHTAESNYLATRDGAGGRAASLAIFADVDNDGDLDVFSGSQNDPANPGTDPGDRNEILLNDGTGRFELADVPDSDLPQDELLAIAGASFTDMNRDGDIDLFIGNWYEAYGSSINAQPERLYFGDGEGGFDDRSARFGLSQPVNASIEERNSSAATKPSYGVTACDVNDDAWPDLLVMAYGRQFNELWMGGPPPLTETGIASGLAGDGNTDFTDNEFYRCYCQTTGACSAPAPRVSCSTPRWNPGFDDQPFRLNGNTFTIACADVDNDGDMDLLTGTIRHWWAGENSDKSELLLNDGDGNFTRPGNEATGLAREWSATDWNEGDIHVAVADFDNDGRKDLLVNSSDYPETRLFFYHQQPDGSFVEKAKRIGLDHPRAASAALGDFDRDGDLDMIVGFSRMRCAEDCPWDSSLVRYYRNDSGGNALRLELTGGAGSNQAGIGTRVRVRTGELVQTYEVGGGYGHMAMQHGTELLIGTGDRCTADEVEVRRPDASGTLERFDSIRANYDVELIAGESKPSWGASWQDIE